METVVNITSEKEIVVVSQYVVRTLYDVFSPTLATDHSYSGKTFQDVAGEALSFGDVCYRDKINGDWRKANGASLLTIPGLAMCVASSIAEDATGLFLLEGFVRDDSWAWTVDNTKEFLYVSCSIAGRISESYSLASGSYNQVVASIYSATKIFFKPSLRWVKI